MRSKPKDKEKPKSKRVPPGPASTDNPGHPQFRRAVHRLASLTAAELTWLRHHEQECRDDNGVPVSQCLGCLPLDTFMFINGHPLVGYDLLMDLICMVVKEVAKQKGPCKYQPKE